MHRSFVTTVGPMKKLSWWAALSIGIAIGIASATYVLRWTRIDHAEIWTASTAMQGWVGALIGAAGAFMAAILVLRKTLADERKRFQQQRRDDDRRMHAQLTQARQASRRERSFAVRQKRIEAWAEVISCAREFFWYSPEADSVVVMEKRLSAAFLLWSMYMNAGDQALVDDARTVVQHVLAIAREDAAHQRAADRKRMQTASKNWIRAVRAEDLIVGIAKYGALLHREDIPSQREGVEWFREQAAK